MLCKNCQLDELHLEIMFEGVHNLSLLPHVVAIMQVRNACIQADQNRIVIKEHGARELIDFVHDHMDAEEIRFCLPGETWKAVSELAAFLDTEWIDRLIADRRALIYLQPIVDAEERIYAYEALARFVDEHGQLLFPGEVFSAAKKRGRLYALDRLCRLKAVETAAPLRQRTFINFIPTSIYSPEHCLKSTVELAHQLGADPSLFVFEVVESEKTEDVEHLKRILSFYKRKGFRYALDDAGEGYSTLELLADLTPHYMKLDKGLVQNVAQDRSKQRKAERFLQAAVQFGSVPLAEGIETKEDYEWLKQCGYRLFQGYLFGKPAPLEESDMRKSEGYSR